MALMKNGEPLFTYHLNDPQSSYGGGGSVTFISYLMPDDLLQIVKVPGSSFYSGSSLVTSFNGFLLYPEQ